MMQIVYLSFLFAFSELILMLVKRSGNGPVKTRKDRGSLIFLWVMITAGFIGGFIMSRQPASFLSGAGVALIAVGLIIRWVAIIQLGKSFTVDVAITDVAELKTDGLYKWVRHPSYQGLMIIVIGFSATMNSLYSFAVFVIPVFLAVSYRISVEEKLLISEFGVKYLKYMDRTKKLIPGIY